MDIFFLYSPSCDAEKVANRILRDLNFLHPQKRVFLVFPLPSVCTTIIENSEFIHDKKTLRITQKFDNMREWRFGAADDE